MRGMLTILVFAAGTAGAAEPPYPVRPLRVVVPQSAGGSTDLVARLVSQKLAEAVGQSVIVDNRPGAGSIIGTDLVAKANPDGYTLLVVASSITLSPSLHKKLPFDPIRDLAPVTLLSAFPNMLAVHPSLAAKSVQDLIALAKARPGQINYGSSGAATGTHLSAELFKMMTGVDMVHVPYRGGAPAVTALLGGQVQLNFATLPSVLPHVRANRLRALGVTTARRSPAAPDVPTIAEAGVPGYDHAPWNGMLAPARTPAAVVSRLGVEAGKAVHTAEVKAALAQEGAEPVGSGPAVFATVIREETVKWAKVIRAAGITAD